MSSLFKIISTPHDAPRERTDTWGSTCSSGSDSGRGSTSPTGSFCGTGGGNNMSPAHFVSRDQGSVSSITPTNYVENEETPNSPPVLGKAGEVLVSAPLHKPKPSFFLKAKSTDSFPRSRSGAVLALSCDKEIVENGEILYPDKVSGNSPPRDWVGEVFGV